MILPVIGMLLMILLFTGGFLFWIFKRQDKRQVTLSPYTDLPLRLAETIHLRGKIKVIRFMKKQTGYDNPPIDFNKASFCRETGRIFPSSVNWRKSIHLDWSFISKRYPGDYVSWGSLTKEQQDEILSLHGSLEGFQTAFSSPLPAPSQIEKKYAYKKPGPLYVDVKTKVVVGWKSVPESALEVLIVQKPMKRYYL